MSITIHQRRGIAKINECFNQLEKMASENNIDLDVLMNIHKYEGVDNPIDEKQNLNVRAESRKRVFEKEQNKIPYYKI